MLSVAYSAMLVPLSAFTVSDVATRTIPIYLTAPALALSWLGMALGFWPWYPWSALLAFLAFLIADLPRGDQKAVSVVVGFLPICAASVAIALSLACGMILLVIGAKTGRLTIAWPFFPWIAGSTLAARMLA